MSDSRNRTRFRTGFPGCMNRSLKFRANSQSNSQRINHFRRKYMKYSSWQLGFFLFVWLVPYGIFLFWGRGSEDLWMFQFLMDVLKQNLCSDRCWSLFSFRVIHFSVKGWCFHTFIIHVTCNVCCICYESLYLGLDICTNLGELNLLNTQNNLLKDPPVKPWWFGYGSSGLNCKLPSFSVELIQKIILSRSEFDYIIGKKFIIINCCMSGTPMSSSLLFDWTNWGKFGLFYR